MVLEEKETHKSMEQNREPEINLHIMWSINLQQKSQDYPMGKGEFLQ